MRILVTGANGYLGRGIINRLLDYGHEVVATDLQVDDIDKRAEAVQGNIFEMADPYHRLLEPDTVLHLAWRNGFIHNAASHFEDLPKHDAFLKNLMESGIKKVCVMGSMHEIGFYEGSINENTPCNPMTMYGIAKNALRQSIQAYGKEKGVDFLWLRGFYIVGNLISGSSIFSKIALADRNGQKEFPFTMGQSQYDFLDYDIFCKQAVLAVSQEKVLGIVNICSGTPEKLCDRVERFIKENGYDIVLQYGKFPDRPYDSKAIWGDDTKIREILATN